MSHRWGQYSPYFAVPSDISSDVPDGCSINFAQVLSRHGARDPTRYKTNNYRTLVKRIKRNVRRFEGKYAFLKEYTYKLGANELTAFGQQEMVNSGAEFYSRYRTLAQQNPLFVRANDRHRVVQSAENFTQGFHEMMRRDKEAGRKSDYPYDILVISDKGRANDTLSHKLCDAFVHQHRPTVASKAQSKWRDIFVPPIRKRLQKDLPGFSPDVAETTSLMDLCPFETVASPNGSVSPFCHLFSQQEWQQYSYYQSLGKYYGFGHGNPLGPTQGVGWVNELIARMTASPVKDTTSVNHTLDDDMTTFPIGEGHVLFADFSHDNDMTGIFSAMGLYNTTKPLAPDGLEPPETNGGYSAGWTVPFAGRLYVEKMQCASENKELVRVIVNDRVQPLEQCGGDRLGRCTLDAFVRSLQFARDGGKWKECFR